MILGALTSGSSWISSGDSGDRSSAAKQHPSQRMHAQSEKIQIHTENAFIRETSSVHNQMTAEGSQRGKSGAQRPSHSALQSLKPQSSRVLELATYTRAGTSHRSGPLAHDLALSGVRSVPRAGCHFQWASRYSVAQTAVGILGKSCK